MAFFGIIINFSLQILKSKHLIFLSFRDISRDSEFRIFIPVEKRRPLVVFAFKAKMTNTEKKTDLVIFEFLEKLKPGYLIELGA